MEHSGVISSINLSTLDGHSAESQSNIPFLEPKDGVDAMKAYADAAAQAWTSVDTSHPDSGLNLNFPHFFILTNHRALIF